MAVVASRDEFVDLVRKSNLIPAERLEAFLRECGPDAEQPLALAEALRAAGLVTRFQVEQLLQGRHRGFELGKYRILDPVGRGAMGVIYLCEHKEMRNHVAVKILPHKAIKQDPTALARFKREARAAAALD